MTLKLTDQEAGEISAVLDMPSFNLVLDFLETESYEQAISSLDSEPTNHALHSAFLMEARAVKILRSKLQSIKRSKQFSDERAR